MTTGDRRASWGRIRYAQVWEDADVLLEALQIQPGEICLSIASAGDNALAMLAENPEHVFAIDNNPSQLACLELRVAAFRELSHRELLEFTGSIGSSHRQIYYQRCRPLLTSGVRDFWDANAKGIAQGIAACGKFERYFQIFRSRVLPLVHSRRRILELLVPRSEPERLAFYREQWNNWRWRLLFRFFFSRFTMSRLGRDPRFFRYAHGDISQRILRRAEYAVTVLDPSQNPYLHWILMGFHGTSLPFALRAENFERIRANLDRLSWRCESLQNWLRNESSVSVHKANLSDVFEYMSCDETQSSLSELARVGKPGGRIAYWNTFVPRSRPESLAGRLTPLREFADELHRRDRAFFYDRFVVEQFT